MTLSKYFVICNFYLKAVYIYSNFVLNVTSTMKIDLYFLLRQYFPDSINWFVLILFIMFMSAGVDFYRCLCLGGLLIFQTWKWAWIARVNVVFINLHHFPNWKRHNIFISLFHRNSLEFIDSYLTIIIHWAIYNWH